MIENKYRIYLFDQKGHLFPLPFPFFIFFSNFVGILAKYFGFPLNIKFFNVTEYNLENFFIANLYWFSAIH